MRTDDLTDKIADPTWEMLGAEWVNFLGFWFGLITGFNVHRCEFAFHSLDYANERINTKCKQCGKPGYR